LLVGFIYAIFNIKVPYIPTPKEDTHENYWKLCIPNILAVLICTLGIWYGLSRDWTPYSIAMASYGAITSSMLGFIVIMSQQRFLLYLEKKIKNSLVVSRVIEAGKNLIARTQYV